MLEGSTGRPLIHLRAINPHVIGLLTSRTLAGEHLSYLARQDGQRPTAAVSTSNGSNAGVSAFAFQVAVRSVIFLAYCLVTLLLQIQSILDIRMHDK